MRRGLVEMEKVLAPAAGGPGGEEMWPNVKRYLTTILKVTRGKELSVRSERELETLAEALDALLSGNIARAGDTLIQRFKALEWTAGNRTPWSVAEHLELIPATDRGTVTRQERAIAQGIQIKESKMRALLNAPKDWKGSGSPGRGREGR